jgi:hypothetical protein
LPLLSRYIVDARVEARVYQSLVVEVAAELQRFLYREGQQAQDPGASGQRLADRLRDAKLLAAGQHELAAAAHLIDVFLHVGDELRRPLNLVDDRRLAKSTKKTARILDGEIAPVGGLEVRVGEIGECVATEGRLARLPRPRERENRVAGEKPPGYSFELAPDEHR